VSLHLEQLVESLLYEGYALYPYTPGATKNATPTPFGIVYPPAYAAGSGATFDHLQLDCVLAEHAPVSATVRFLQATAAGHAAEERRLELDGPCERVFAFGELRGRARLVTSGSRVRLRVENETPFEGGTRAEALTRSLLSTHPLVRAAGGCFLSPLEAEGCENVNTWPVLATSNDDTVLGAAIVLPDHPRIAPESRGSLFDATEIEEALLLHVHALSDGEREAIAGEDPVVSDMIERAAAAGPDDLMRLHGVMRPVEDPPGVERAESGGRLFVRGGRVRLQPSGGADAYDLLLAGRTALIERIYVDYDDEIHLAVTVDDDPAQELMRESGRFLFFRPHEVEVVA
jgi:hypothetical protein